MMLDLIEKKLAIRSRLLVLSIFFVLFVSCFSPITLSQNENQALELCNMIFDGQILYAPMWSTTTYLLDNTGTIDHTWSSIYLPGVGVWWLGDGTILRTIRVGVGPGPGGAGGGVQKVRWDGTVVWDFRYNTNGVLSHHDVKTLPNGNVLLIAWETKSRDEAIAAGRNPNYIGIQGMMPDHIIEVQPTGPSTGEIVWEWHVWDHLIQDYDPSKPYYGVVGEHPELVDLNYITSSYVDWLHTNSIDYNEEFDQIMMSVHNYNEIWVIDHSTTTEEAAGHSGGNSGKGGDLLYRWGNPQTYDAGDASDQKLFCQHDAQWIDEGCPGEGNILLFNNGPNRPGSPYSSVDELVPPVNATGEYYLEPGSAYGPEEQIWIYTADPPTSFYAYHFSGAQRLPSGNTLICDGETGKIFEVTPECTTVWQYNTQHELFKVVYIPPDEPSQGSNLYCTGALSWRRVKPGTMVNGSFQVQNIGEEGSLLDWAINSSSITWGEWFITPENGEDLTPADGTVTVHVSVIAPNETNSRFEGYLRVENIDNPDDFEIIPVTLRTPLSFHTPFFQWTLVQQLFKKIMDWYSVLGKFFLFSFF